MNSSASKAINARLLAAAYTAFDRAGRELGIDATELAEKIDLARILRTARDVVVRSKAQVGRPAYSVTKADIDALASSLLRFGPALHADAERNGV